MAFGIYRKVAECDTLLTQTPGLQQWIREVHPEVCFRTWNENQPMAHYKKRREGKTARQHLIAGAFGPGAFQAVHDQYLRRDVATDDVADAFAALWTALRLHQGMAESLPHPPHVGDFGLLTAIWH